MITKWNGPEIVRQVRAATMRGIVRGTEAVRNEAVRLVLSPDKTGRVYRRRGVEHQASAPGEPPATDTGGLASSIDTSYQEAKLQGTVTAHAKYAQPLEFGTQRMAPRPFMRPALAHNEKFIREAITEEIGKVVGE